MACAASQRVRQEAVCLVLSGPGASQAGLQPGEKPQLPGGAGRVGGGRPVKQMVRHQELIAIGRLLNCPPKKKKNNNNRGTSENTTVH